MTNNPITGLLKINKPVGITTYDCIRHIKRILKTKTKIGQKSRGSKRERQTYPHCNKNVAVNIYARYHGNRYKNLDKSA